MKKRYLYIAGAKHWNNLLGKFTKLQKRLQLLSNNSDSTRYKKLVNKLQNIFSKLEKMQYQTGIKVAGTSLTLVLSAFTANAQFAAGELMKSNDPVSAGGFSASPVYADIDGDGDLDLYVGKHSGEIKVFTNDNGLFTAAPDLQAGGTTIDVITYSSPSFADIDGDGDLDLYVGNINGNIKTFTNNSGVFTAAADLQAGGTNIDVSNNAAPTFADLDGDGDLDLYVGNRNGEIRVFTNNSGVFAPVTFLQASGTIIDVGTYASPAFADIDGDGDLDLYVGEYYGTIKVFTNNNGLFTAAPDLQADGTTIDEVYRLNPTFADLDGDGDLDLYVGRYYGEVDVFTNSSGVFTAAPDLRADANIDAGASSNPTFADIDADGDLDLYVGESFGRINILTNNSAVFSKEPLFQVGVVALDIGNSSIPTFADIDGDGDLDLYVGVGTGEIKVFTNNSGLFTAAADLQAGGSAIDVGYLSSPTFADIDGDSDLDLYVGNVDGEIKVFINNSGIFAVGTNLQAGGTDIDIGGGSSIPAFADGDGDGDLDLYVGGYNGEITFYENNSGVFAAGTSLQAGGVNIDVNNNASPTFADIDGDGDLDLYVGGYYGEITFYENTGAAAILVSSITVQGQGGVSTIATPAGTLQIEAAILPVNASNSTYTWSLVNGTGSASIDANGLLTAATDGTVTVTATANDASGETAGMLVTISNQSVGIDAATANAINIYPNPVQNELFIQLNDIKITEISILDYSGRLVKSIVNNNSKHIDVTDLKQGIYILQVATENGNYTNRFVKK